MWNLSFARAAVILAIGVGLMWSTGSAVTQPIGTAALICGGKGSLPCPSGSWCARDRCETKGRGTCQTIPFFCTNDLAPVCGCDGKTYNNDCLRRQAQVGKKKNGECRPLVIKGTTPTKDTIGK